MKKLKFAALSLTLAALLCLARFPVKSARAAEDSADYLYESFDDYDTLGGRFNDGTTALEQMKLSTFCGNPAGFDAALSDPVGSGTGKSLKITQKGNKQVIAWSNGTKDAARMNRAGAKYVRLWVKNLSAGARDLVVYITDITQRTVDAAANPAYEGQIPDIEQEHWVMKWNKSAVLETEAGEKSVVKSVNGMSLSIPKDFCGTLSIPLSAQTLDRAGWWLAEGGKDYANNKLDLDKIFAVSFGFPEATNISSADPETWSVFEVDNVTFSESTDVDEYLDAQKGGDAAAAQKVVRPLTDEVTVDFDSAEIAVAPGVTLGAFKEMFSLPAGYEIVVKDKYSFDVTDGDELTDGCEATFTDGKAPYAFTLTVTGDENGGDEPPADEDTHGGCGGVIAGGTGPAAGILLVCFAAAALAAARRKFSMGGKVSHDENV